MSQYILSVICVFLICVGQILFKYASIYTEIDNHFLNIKSVLLIFLAFIIYGASSLLWVYILKGSELSKVYPMMALAFIIVPVISYFLFQETFSLRYLLGTSLVIVGIILTTGG